MKRVTRNLVIFSKLRFLREPVINNYYDMESIGMFLSQIYGMFITDFNMRELI